MIKVFKDLEKIKESFGCDPAYYGLGAEFENVKQTLLKAEKSAKALKIIFEKKIDIQYFKVCETVEEYNSYFLIDEEQELTEYEFNIIKEETK